MTTADGPLARPVALTALFAVAITVALAIGVARPARADDAVSITTTIDGVEVAGSSAAHPVALRPDSPAELDIAITNSGGDAVTLRTVQLNGRVIGLTFFDYATSVDLTVDPGTSTHLRYVLDLTGLDGQATGLIPTQVSVRDSQRQVLASQDFVADVRGSLRSVYGLFGLALLIVLVGALAGAAFAIATHRLPRNRLRRGLRMLTVGIGLGLVLVFTLSAVRVWSPSPARWFVVVGISALVFFVLGYLTPAPVDDDEPDDDDELDDEFAPMAAP